MEYNKYCILLDFTFTIFGKIEKKCECWTTLFIYKEIMKENYLKVYCLWIYVIYV